MGRVSGKRGPDPTPTGEMSPGSARRARREAEAKGIPTRDRFVRKPSPPRAPVPGDEFAYGDPRRDSLETWLPLLLLIPRFDPRVQSKGYRFDGRLARRVIGWFERHVHHLTGPRRGQLVRLDPWQRSLFANAFGWVHDGGERDGKRRFRKVLLYIAKKNGKTTIVGGLAAYAFTRLKEGGAKVLTAATHRGQARGVWEVARDTIEADPRTLAKCIVWNASIQLRRDRTAILEPISGEAKGEDGADCFFAILDELHRQNDTKLLTILDRGGSGRDEPMFWMLTTADEIRESPCNSERDYAVAVRENAGDDLAPGWDPWYLPAVYELSEEQAKGDGWTKEENWKAANPGLGTIKSLDSMRAGLRGAVAKPADRIDFQRLDLNLRVENAYAPIKMAKWGACVGPVVEALGRPRTWLEMREWLLGRPCWMGVDLAETLDMVALSLWFPEERAVLSWFWACQAAAKERHARNDPLYLRWRDAGALDLVDGDAIEYAPVVEKAAELFGSYKVLHVGCDPYKAGEFSYAAQRLGVEVTRVGQDWRFMTEPCDRLVEMVELGTLVHGGHPVLTWNAQNLRFRVTGQRGKKPQKKSEAAKIDGIAAALTAMAAETLLRKPPPPSTLGVVASLRRVRDEVDAW